MNYKKIDIGKHIEKVAELRGVSLLRACKFFKCNKGDILDMYTKHSLDCELLLKWSKLLDYNFFMFYHTHLQFYKPSAVSANLKGVQLTENDKSYVFRKNLYSVDVVNWLMNKLDNGELTPKEIMLKYNIPRTTLYRWIRRHNN